MKRKLFKLLSSTFIGAFLGLLLTYSVPQANAAVGAIFDTINRGFFVTTGAYHLTVGAAGTGTVNIMSDGVNKVAITTGGSAFVPVSNPAGTAVANGILTSGTIDSTIFYQRVISAGAVTGVILENGTSHGQMVFVVSDKDSGGSITFAAEATSNVCSGVSAALAAGEGALFIYDALDTCWSELGT